MSGAGTRASLRRAAWCAAVVTIAVALAPGSAQGAIRAGTTVTFPTSVALGEVGAPASIRLRNENTGLNFLFSNVVCNAGDASALCSLPERGIVLDPSCTTIAAGACGPGAADPGVFDVASSGVGRAGSACSGVTFAIDPVDASGAVVFRPLPPGTRVTLPGFGSRCVIDFTFDVLRLPSADADAGTPGVQTAQATSHTQRSNVFAIGSDTARATALTTIRRAAPSIATVASPDIVLGAGTLSDQATVNGRAGSLPGATVDFRLYGPDDADCSRPAVFESLDVPYPIGGGSVGSGAFTPTRAGTYRWVAMYSGDANNEPAVGGCGDADETRVVTRAVPSIATLASPDIVLGAGTLSDQATVDGRASPLPGATVDFRLYGPDDADCSGPAVFASLDVPYPVGGGAVASGEFTPTRAGTYRWVAMYSGDANNEPAVGGCGDADETRVVTRAVPSIATLASPDVLLGAGTLSDQATVTGRISPLPGATVDFRLYGPDDADCSGPAVFESLDVPYPVAGGAVASAAFAPTRTGTYRWVAMYSGDANNEPAVGGCGDADETRVVTRAVPSIATVASPDIVLGAGTLSDQATVTGRISPLPGATVDFRLYGPDDADCSGPAVFEFLDVPYPVDGGAVASAAYMPTRAGTYRWIATYSGDANNEPAAGACGDANETRVVARTVPSIATLASPDIVLGAGTLSDQATVTGRTSPLPGATVDFRLYGPDDADCGGPAVFTSLDVAYPVAGGPVQSGSYSPTAAGTYRWVASYGGDANNDPAAGSCGDADETTDVARASPSIATAASPDIVLGAGTLSDQATVNGRVQPLAGADVDFRLYGPDDPDCSGPPAFESLDVPYPVDGAAVTSAAFTPTRAGTYRWTAAYSGDANNAPAAGACNDADETHVVTQAPTSIATAASPDIVLGAGTLSDQATVNGRVQPLADADVDFRLYGPDDPDCSGPPAFESLDVPYPADGGLVQSETFDPETAGTYRWVAEYSGDANNGSVAGGCGDASETTIVARNTPALATTASPDIELGEGSLTDEATVTGRVNPQAGATIDFRLYGPDDATCSRPAVFESSGVPYPVPGGAVRSGSFTPTGAGAYRWVASYQGDRNNAPVVGTCTDGNLTRVTAPAAPPPAPTPVPPPSASPPAAVTPPPPPVSPASPSPTPPPPARSPNPTTGSSSEPDSSASPAADQADPDPEPAPGAADAPANEPAAAPDAPDAGSPAPSAASGSSSDPEQAAQRERRRQAARKSAASEADSRAEPAAAMRDEGLAPYDPRSEPEKTIALLVTAFTLLQLASGAGGLARARGRDAPGATRGSSGAQGRSGQEEAPSYDMGYEGVDVEFLGAGLGAVARGDRSRTWGWPGTQTLDRVSYALPARLSPRSPLLARVVADGTYLRAILGSASLLGLLGGLALGIVAVQDTGGAALPPAAVLTIAIAVLGVFDAAAGLLAVLTFTIGIAVLGGVDTNADLRLMLGLSALWFVVPLLAGAARPLRRAPTRSFEESWERAADFVIASLIGAWAVQGLMLALPGLAGLHLSIDDHANMAAYCVLAALVVRLGFETIAAHAYPRRLDVAEPAELPEPSSLQRIMASAVRTTIFVFFAYVIVGTSWQLWVASALFFIPQVLAVFSDRFPNSPRLFRALPSGLVELVVMLFVVTVFAALLLATMDEDADTFLANSFVLLSLPGFLLSLLGLVGREGDERAMGWGKRIAGVGLLIAGILLGLGLLL